MTVALPMYFPARVGAVQDFWDVLRAELQARLDPHWADTIPTALDWPGDYLAHWLQPDLLLSQSCGYPLTHALQGRVQVLGTFAYDVPGAHGVLCHSQVVQRSTDARRTLQAFQGSTVAFNAPDSQSGYNALRALIAPLAEQGRFFGSALETGAHLESLRAVREGRADLAAIDAVTWTLAQEAEPALAQDLRVLQETAPYPGLPLITALHTPAPMVRALQEALFAVATQARHATVRAPLRITGFEQTTVSDYAICQSMEDQARALGVQTL